MFHKKTKYPFKFLESELLDDKSSSVESQSQNHRDSSSPIKEAILTKFAKLAPVSLTPQPQGQLQLVSESPEFGATPVKNETSNSIQLLPHFKHTKSLNKDCKNKQKSVANFDELLCNLEPIFKFKLSFMKKLKAFFTIIHLTKNV